MMTPPTVPSETCRTVIDRLPPQSLEAEQSVLGAILIDRDAVVEVAEFLRPEDFYRQANGRIYAAIVDLFERREPIDIVTVAESLERREELEAVGGRAYLSSLSNETPTAVHAAQYARIVERKAVLRNLIGAAGRIAGIGYEDPAEIQEAIDRAESELFAVSQNASTRDSRRSSRCCTTRTTGSTTCTPTAARSPASGPGSPTSTP